MYAEEINLSLKAKLQFHMLLYLYSDMINILLLSPNQFTPFIFCYFKISGNFFLHSGWSQSLFFIKTWDLTKGKDLWKTSYSQSFSIALETLWRVASVSEKEYNQLTPSATWSIMRYSEGVLILSNRRDETIIFPDNQKLSRDLLKGMISIKLLPAC